jgi:hypothetical protein
MSIYMIFRSDDRKTLLAVVEAGSNTHAREIAASMLPGYTEADLMAVRKVS